MVRKRTWGHGDVPVVQAISFKGVRSMLTARVVGFMCMDLVLAVMSSGVVRKALYSMYWFGTDLSIVNVEVGFDVVVNETVKGARDVGRHSYGSKTSVGNVSLVVGLARQRVLLSTDVVPAHVTPAKGGFRQLLGDGALLVGFGNQRDNIAIGVKKVIKGTWDVCGHGAFWCTA